MDLDAIYSGLCLRIRRDIELLHKPSDEEIWSFVDEAVTRAAREGYLPVKTRVQWSDQIFNMLRRYDLLQPLIDDASITEIMVNGTGPIHVEQNGRIRQLETGFTDIRILDNVIQKMVSAVNRTVNDGSPICDARLEDGSRIHVVLKSLALNGPILTIRKFPEKPLTMEDLIEKGSITEEAAAFLAKLVRSRYNIFVAGGTGSGKTTFLNVLSQTIPLDERLITLEDSAELQLRLHKNLVRMETRTANTSGEGEIPMGALIKASLRMRPDRIIVGEVRGAEALDMLQAMNTGHDGSLSTGHANSAQDMLTRLETMVLSAASMPVEAIRRQIVSALDIIVFLKRYSDGSRQVAEIHEVLGLKDGEVAISPLFIREFGEEEVGLKRTGSRLVHVQKLKEAGCDEDGR